MPARQRRFDRRLSCAQPVERRVDLLGGHRAKPERHPERVGRRRLIECSRSCQLGCRIDQASYNQRQSQFAPAIQTMRQKPIKANPARRTQRCRHLPVRQGTHDLQTLACWNQLFAAQRRA